MRDTIAVCLVQAFEEFQKESLSAIYTQAKEYGLYVQVFNTFEELRYNNLNDQGEKSVFELIDYDRLCGMIIFIEKIKDNALSQRLIENGEKNRIPVVVVDRKVEDCYSITFDYSNAFEVIVRHLMEVHHCRSLFVMGGIRNNDFSDERINVVRKVAAEYGVELKEEDIGYGDFWEVPCREEMTRFLESGRPLPDAFIAANDLMAITICHMLHKAGYRVPRDTIVTGFDGIEEERYTTPRLTTAQQDITAGGKRAVDIIWRVKQNQPVEKENVIPFSVRFSQSCGCMPIGETEASDKIQEMFTLLKNNKHFTRYMYEMMDILPESKTLEGILDKLPGYFGFFPSFRHIYLCVENGYLDAFDSMNEQIMKNNRKLVDRSEIDMVLLGEWHADKGFDIPLLCFNRKDLLPPERKCAATDHLMFVPLHVQEDIIGYLAVELDPTENDYNHLWTFSIHLSHIMDSVRNYQQMQSFNYKLKTANEKLEDLYIRDPLTGIYNRRGFYQDIVRYIKEHNYGWVMVVSVDLNGLKEINDTYGHGEGDFAIRTAGRALDQCVGKKGICARFGGDEFSAAIFYNEYEQYAEQDFHEHLLHILADVNRSSGKAYQITCSCGVHMTPVNPDINIDELLKEADRKMYLEKKHHYEELGYPDRYAR